MKFLESQKAAYGNQVNVALETAYSHRETSYQLKKLVQIGRVKKITLQSADQYSHHWHYLPEYGEEEIKNIIKQKLVYVQIHKAYT